MSDFAKRSQIALRLERAGLADKVIFETDQHTKDFIVDSACVVISPGVRKDASPIQWAREAGVPLFGEIEFAWMFCRNRVIAITGSNGKTTVSTLVYRVIQKSGKRARLCGNIGTPFAQHVLDLVKDEIVILEISSFQLEFIKTFAPYIAVLLNCTQNHLDRHATMKEYFHTKIKIFKNQLSSDFSVLNYDDEKIRMLSKDLKSKIFFYNGPREKKIYPADHLNFLAARKVAHILNISDDCVDEVFRNFSGLEHRMEKVRVYNEIVFINDSKATSPEAGIWALLQIPEPIIMICGGRNKNSDFSIVRDLVQKKVKKMFVFGEAKEEMQNIFSGVIAITQVESLERAVHQSYRHASSGDHILFSPMCASFDMFRNFEERGKVFKEIVHQL